MTKDPAQLFGAALRWGTSQGAFAIVFASLILDGGELFRISLIGAFAHGALAALVLIRRRRRPTPLDLALAAYGFWPCAAAALAWRLVV